MKGWRTATLSGLGLHPVVAGSQTDRPRDPDSSLAETQRLSGSTEGHDREIRGHPRISQFEPLAESLDKDQRLAIFRPIRAAFVFGSKQLKFMAEKAPGIGWEAAIQILDETLADPNEMVSRVRGERKIEQ